MKYIVVVPDGMTDHPIEELGLRTPLEAAETPNMDYVAKNGVCGQAKTFYTGLPYDSSIANMAIMGYDPRKYFTGRAPLEAANMGIELGAGDIALRCNLITVADGKIADFTAGHISNVEGGQIIRELNNRLGSDGIEFHPGVSYRNILVLRSQVKPSLDLTFKQPHDIVGEPVAGNMIHAKKKSAQDTVKRLNNMMETASEFLADHEVNRRRVEEGMNPANWIWFWGAGSKPMMPSFKESYGMDGSLISAVDLLKGIGKVIKLKVLDVKGATGYIDTNYEGKADAAVESLEEADFTYVHVEATDEAGHEGNIEHKIKAIEDVDKKVLGRIMDKMDDDYALLLMPDHATPIKIKKHTNEPVPYAIYDRHRKPDDVTKFTEKEIKEKGSQPPIEAHKLMNKLKNA